MSSATERRAPFCDRAERIVLAWGARYTHGLDGDVADDRIAELRSDLWEQREDGLWSHERDPRIALSILGRMLRGIPADLGWRRDELTGGQRPPYSPLTRAWTARWSVVLTASIGGLTLALAIYTVARLMMTSGVAAAIPDTSKVSLLVGIVALTAGIALIRRERQRWLGALWIGVGTLISLPASAATLFVMSATARSYATSAAAPLAWVALAALGVFFVVVAVSWLLDLHVRASR